jgi:transaldolase/glucose-6-phosphate isomerase
LDSTHPRAVADVERELDPDRSLIVVSSKSGTTLETLSLFEYFWGRLAGAGASRGRRFCAITDPGSPLAEKAEALNFRGVFKAPVDVGGRFSALSVFGLVPALLAGVDGESWERAALSEWEENRADADPTRSRALRLGALLGEAVSGRDKLTLRVSPGLPGFADWIEQLVAESLGKEGRGLVPLVGEPGLPAPEYGPDRLFVSHSLGREEEAAEEAFLKNAAREGHPGLGVALEHRDRIAALFLRWEIAVAAAGAVMKVHPFNQPDVQLSKEKTQEVMSGRKRDWDRDGERDFTPARPEELRKALAAWTGSARPGDYFALLAFLPPRPAVRRRLSRVREGLSRRAGLPVTMGFGPRFLHSTGQMHKGGPPTGLFLQLVDEPSRDVEIPGRDYGFSALIHAQALGDYRALRERGRRVLRVNLGRETEAGLAALEGILSSI